MNTPARQERWLEIREKQNRTEQKEGSIQREQERVNRKQEH